MSIAKLYRMQGAPDDGDKLLNALVDLAGLVSALPGCKEVAVLRHLDGEASFMFIEKWASAEAYKAAAEKLPKTALAAVMAALAAPPESGSWQYVLPAD